MKNKLLNAFVIALIMFQAVAPIGALAWVGTDQADYAPGSVVTISGDNSDGVGFMAGEPIHVNVAGPNGYTAACDAVADDNGAWSCQVTLWANELAGGDYSYTATGQTSGISQTGTFSDSVTSVTITSPTSGTPVTVTSLPANVTISFNYITSATGTTIGQADVLGTTATNSKSLTPGTGSDNIVVTIPAGTLNGSYNAKVTVTNTTGTGSNNKNDVKNNAIIVNVPTCTAPSTSDPSSATKTVGDSVSFSVTASGTAPLSYQWRKGGVDISGANSSSYSIASVLTSDAGSYDVVVSNGCGSVTSGAATLTVNKAAATVTLSNMTQTYTGGALTPTATTVPAGLTIVWTNAPQTNAGSYSVTATVNDANYQGSASGTLVISPADATCTISGGTFPYDTTPHGATGSCKGVNGETLAGLDLGDSFINVAGGTAHWIFTDVTGNYNDDEGDVAITITPVDATCTISGGTFPYDATPHGATGSCVGIGGESAGTLDLGDSFTNVSGGTAHWVFTGNGNYNDDEGDVAITITPVDATCSISGGTFPYDAASHGATGSCSGINGEDAGSLDLGDSFTNVPGGTAHWVFTGNGNYNDDEGDVSITITKAMLTVTADNQSKILNAPNPAFTFTYSGFQGSDDAGDINTEPTCSSVAANSPVGSYPINCSGGSDNNYDFDYVPGTLKITYAIGGMCMGTPGHTILQPINSDGTSVFKQKSTVPAKFRVCDANGVSIGTPGVVSEFVLVRTSATVGPDVNEPVDSTVQNDTAFRWSSTDQQWIFNINTKNQTANRTYYYRITLNDGSKIEFQFGLK